MTRPADVGRAFECRRAHALRFGTRRRGARAYLAVSGGIDTTPGARQPRDAHRQPAWVAWGDARSSPAIVCRLGSAMRSDAGGIDPSGRLEIALQYADGRVKWSQPLQSACASQGRRLTGLPPTALNVLRVERVHGSPRSRTGWDFDLRGKIRILRGADMISDATPSGLAAGAAIGRSNSPDGGSPDDRRVSEDRDRHFGRHRHGRSARSRRLDRVCRLYSLDEALAACAAQERALRAIEDFSRMTALRMRWQRIRRDRVVQRRPARDRSRHSVSAGRPTGFSRPDRPTEIVRALELARIQGACPCDDAGRWLERARFGRRHPRPCNSSARRRDHVVDDDGHVRADAAVTINGLVRWTILHARPGWRPGRAHPGPSAGRSSETRILPAG